MPPPVPPVLVLADRVPAGGMSGTDRRLLQLLLALRDLWPDVPVELLAVEMEPRAPACRALSELGILVTGGLGGTAGRLEAGAGRRAAVVVHGRVGGRRLLGTLLQSDPCAELLVDGTCRDLIPSPPAEPRTVAEALARARHAGGGGRAVILGDGAEPREPGEVPLPGHVVPGGDGIGHAERTGLAVLASDEAPVAGLEGGLARLLVDLGAGRDAPELICDPLPAGLARGYSRPPRRDDAVVRLQRARVALAPAFAGVAPFAALAACAEAGVPLVLDRPEPGLEDLAGPARAGGAVARARELERDPARWAEARHATAELARRHLSPATYRASLVRALDLAPLDPPTPGVGVADHPGARLRPRASRRWAPDLEGSRWAPVFPDQIQTDGVDVGGPRPGDVTDSYQSWRAARVSDERERERARREIAGLTNRPLFSIVTPVHNLPPDVLRAMIESVQAQVYPHWQLCLADDGATWPATRAVLTRAAYHDPRISLVRRDTNGGIVAASNTALALARGEFVALLDHDDELDPMALFEVARLLDRHPELDVVYTDEEKKDEQGVVRWPALKPSFSPDLLTCGNYMCHFSVYRRSVLEAVGGFRDGYDGAQDLDLVLRVVDHTDRIGHIAKPLYSWRMVTGSVAADGDAKPYAFPNGRRAIEDALARRGIEGTVVERPERGLYRVRYRIAGRPRVVLALHADQVVDPAGAQWLGELAEFTDGAFPEAVILDGRLTPGRGRDPWAEVARRLDIPGARPGEALNHLLGTTTADLVLWLDLEARPLDPEWLTALIEHAQRDGVGACGGQLLGPGGDLSMGRLVPPDEPQLDERPAENHFLSAIGESHLLVERNVSALGPVCTIARVVALHGIGGVDASFADRHLRAADATMRLRVRGHELVGTPYARCSMPVTGHRPPADEWERFRRRWRLGEGFVDPYFNPNYRALRALVPSG